MKDQFNDPSNHEQTFYHGATSHSTHRINASIFYLIHILILMFAPLLLLHTKLFLLFIFMLEMFVLLGS